MKLADTTTQCCIAGGGPAGMMLGLLLARGGVDVVVLEKHVDFFRDFRGDTIHPSTFELMHELGLLNEFLKVPHQEISTFTAVFNSTSIKIVDLSHLKVAKPVIGMMPQWDFLKFVETQASRYPSFHLMMNAKATDIIKENGRVTGLTVETKEGTIQVRADIVIGADGRHSVIRQKAGLKVIAAGVPIDVLWLRVSREASDPGQILGRFIGNKLMVMLDRETYWQCAYVIKKGGYETIKQAGLEAFRNNLVEAAPFLADRTSDIKSWDDVKLLSVDVDHLETWYTDGLLCIGDAAHAMSPVGGVGINLAIQDAVAAANILYASLKEKKKPGTDLLAQVQKRRTLATKVIQGMQVFMHNKIMIKNLDKSASTKPPLFLRLIGIFPILRRIPAWIIGMGVRPEHVKTPEVLI